MAPDTIQAISQEIVIPILITVVVCLLIYVIHKDPSL